MYKQTRIEGQPMRPIKRAIKAILPQVFIDRYSDYRFQRSLPPAAKNLQAKDARGLPAFDPGPHKAIDTALRWICRAQDQSLTQDGGVSRSYSLIDGWAASYPETTGYIIPTLLAESRFSNDRALIQRARRMLDWLVAIQFPEGGFQGGMVNQTPRVPVTFNTGQILLGLAIGARELDEPRYLQAMHKAARWLVDTVDDDGCWRRHPTPFAAPGEKAYETHVSWGLFEAERTAPGSNYAETGMQQVQWALTKQRDNGWFDSNCLDGPEAPLTHTIGYVLRGILEAHRFRESDRWLRAALKTGTGLLTVLEEDGRLAGRLNAAWKAECDWVCLTGTVQIAHCFFLIYEATGDERYLDAGRRMNRYVRRTQFLEGDPNMVGGIRGSYPINGEYGAFQYLNWAAKFFIDSNRAELQATS